MGTLVPASYVSVDSGEPALLEHGAFEPFWGVGYGWVVEKSGAEG